MRETAAPRRARAVEMVASPCNSAAQESRLRIAPRESAPTACGQTVSDTLRHFARLQLSVAIAFSARLKRTRHMHRVAAHDCACNARAGHDATSRSTYMVYTMCARGRSPSGLARARRGGPSPGSPDRSCQPPSPATTCTPRPHAIMLRRERERCILHSTMCVHHFAYEFRSYVRRVGPSSRPWPSLPGRGRGLVLGLSAASKAEWTFLSSRQLRNRKPYTFSSAPPLCSPPSDENGSHESIITCAITIPDC